MQCSLILIGKTRSQALTSLESDYTQRIRHYLPFQIEVIPRTKAVSPESEKQDEGQAILKRLRADDYVVLLDERGKEYTSPQFAHWLQLASIRGLKRIVFIIGGAYGFSEQVYARADHQVSLSKMTFAHEMVRTIFVEQLYRACTIIKGEKYHH